MIFHFLSSHSVPLPVDKNEGWRDAVRRVWREEEVRGNAVAISYITLLCFGSQSHFSSQSERTEVSAFRGRALHCFSRPPCAYCPLSLAPSRTIPSSPLSLYILPPPIYIDCKQLNYLLHYHLLISMPGHSL